MSTRDRSLPEISCDDIIEIVTGQPLATVTTDDLLIAPPPRAPSSGKIAVTGLGPRSVEPTAPRRSPSTISRPIREVDRRSDAVAVPRGPGRTD